VSKGGATAPPTVNASDLIGQQGNANITSAEAQSGLNNAGTAGPLGASWWTPTSIDPGTGRPSSWDQTQQLSPQSQGVFDYQQQLAKQLAGVGLNVGNTVGQSTNVGSGLLNTAYNNLTGTSTNDQVTSAENAAYNSQANYLNPQFAEKKSDLAQQLADQGISPGTDAYSRAQGDLGRESTLAYGQAQNAATLAGQQEQNTLFGQQLGMGGLGQGILQGASSELPSLGSLGNFTWAGGLPSQGGSPSGVTPPNIAALQGAANTGNLNSFVGGNTLNNQLLNGLGSLGGTLGNSNLLFGSGGLSGALGANPSTGLLGGLFGSLFGGGAADAEALAAGAVL
jgi:hypothetical protein